MSRHPRRRTPAAACAAIVAAGVLAGCTAGHATAAHTAAGSATTGQTTPATAGRSIRVLQMNLCNSGIAECYTGGRAVTFAESLIRQRRPDIVTVNEVCRADVTALAHAMAAAFGHATVAANFRPARDRRIGGPFRCTNGQQFGDGVVARLPTAQHTASSGLYPEAIQDQNDPEERVWVCVGSAAFAACTTHAANTSTSIALAQCRYFLHEAVPRIRRANADAPVVLGGDLNLPAGHSPSPQECLPTGFRRTDDGARQDVVATPGMTVHSTTTIDMQHTTDHPGLLVELALPQPPR